MRVEDCGIVRRRLGKQPGKAPLRTDMICIAYLEDGRLCRRPAKFLDHQRGGMVCEMHAPKEAA